jgi:peptidoglycan/LPS O-acetylase OafA/YrhL
MAEISNTKFFPALTGIRAFAAITVFLTHAGYILAEMRRPVYSVILTS